MRLLRANRSLFAPPGRRLASFQADMTTSHFHGGGVTWDATGISHSTATLSGGQAFAQGTAALGSAASGVALGLGSSGLFKAAGAAIPIAGTMLNRPQFSKP